MQWLILAALVAFLYSRQAAPDAPPNGDIPEGDPAEMRPISPTSGLPGPNTSARAA